jgi:hypothetical protein
MTDGNEAKEEFRKYKGEQFVYSTVNEELYINLVKHVGIRRSI